MERNARTNGDYNELIKAQFGYDPRVHDKNPIYIEQSGTYQSIVFNEVVQTSESTSTSPLGQTSGRGISLANGQNFRFNSPDYGYIMAILSIVPDTVYTQGLSRMLSRTSQSDYYFPILNNLAPQAILNQELFQSGTNVDSNLFGYQERYEEFKSRENIASGLMALPHTVADYDASALMARRFTTLPTLSNSMVSLSPQNVDMSVFSVKDEPPFDVVFTDLVDKVSPMPFITVPGDMATKM